MPYDVLVKEAYTLIDEIPMEKLPYVVDFLRSANSLYAPTLNHTQADSSDVLEKMFVAADAHEFPAEKVAWNRNDLYGRM